MSAPGGTPTGSQGDPIHVATEPSEEATAVEAAAKIVLADAVVKSDERVSDVKRAVVSSDDRVTQAIRRFTIGFGIFTVVVIFALWLLAKNQADSVRHDTNKAATVGCLTVSRPFFQKHNSFVQDTIQNRQDALRLAIARGDAKGIELQRRSAERLTDDFFHVPSVAECERSILP